MPGNSGLISVKETAHTTPWNASTLSPITTHTSPLLWILKTRPPLNYSPFALIPKSLPLITPTLLGPCALALALSLSLSEFLGRIPTSIFVLKCNEQCILKRTAETTVLQILVFVCVCVCVENIQLLYIYYHT